MIQTSLDHSQAIIQPFLKENIVLTGGTTLTKHTTERFSQEVKP